MSPVTFRNFTETHRRTLPGRIDRSLMKSNSGSDQPKILAGLQFIGLIEPSGKPTAKFELLRDVETDEGLKESWQNLLQEAYPKLFQGFDLTKATQSQIEERFREEYKISGDTVRKAVAFFLALARNSGIALSPYLKTTRTRTNSPGSSRRRPPRTRQEEPAILSSLRENPPSPGRLHRAVQAWIDEIPENGQPWTVEDFEEWIKIFRASVIRAYKIPTV